ncbi:MAG: hypothetical protein K1X53_04350 [Candidatus Sumerlaeaceae bacterium]|nr:hypothetical protein [Candidatus Sumerlaeaceae bacterium]
MKLPLLAYVPLCVLTLSSLHQAHAETTTSIKVRQTPERSASTTATTRLKVSPQPIIESVQPATWDVTMPQVITVRGRNLQGCRLGMRDHDGKDRELITAPSSSDTELSATATILIGLKVGRYEVFAIDPHQQVAPSTGWITVR